MHLTQRERERLLIYVAANLASQRRDDGIKLNYPETVALITDEMMEAARRGASYDSVREAGKTAVSSDETMQYIPEMVDRVDAEIVFPEGTKFVSVAYPVAEPE